MFPSASKTSQLPAIIWMKNYYVICLSKFTTVSAESRTSEINSSTSLDLCTCSTWESVKRKFDAPTKFAN